ncbi:ABC transporter ATP-binding protein [Inquilinus limosus]|uniref:ABC transporter ATP-binding protein n=1 Tax=Inquilinus limosus TaxID=171674 RepID=UPI0004061BBB|nr:oligopeptide/dipeptide ABC transporter ATP-binding protein [Inquilinus limosus]
MTALIEAAGLGKRFTKRLDYAEKTARLLDARIEERTVHAVDGVDLAIAPGEVVGLVGESGCGKSTLGRMMAGILPKSDGAIRWRGRDVDGLAGDAARDARLKAQMIFQDPFASLNPRKRVRDIIGEAPRVHGLVGRREADGYVQDMMRRVGLDPAYRDRFPHQFSGGQRQRIGIARALAVQPDFLVCDESIAALDVSIQAQILNLFLELKRELGLTYLFISHDLGVVEHISDRVVIMYLGRVVETAATAELFARPLHPYTAALLNEVPRLSNRKRKFETIKGEIPSPLHPPTGCRFHPRCPMATDRCRTERPALRPVAPGHQAACHLI